MMEKEIMNVSEQVNQVVEPQMETQTVTRTALPVFTAVLKHFLNQLESIDTRVTRKLRQSLLSQISLCISSLEERQYLNAWIEGDIEQLVVKIGLADMQHCIHHAYRSACDSFGPTSADEILTKSNKRY